MAKKYTFTQKTMESCISVSASQIGDFCSVYPPLLRALVPEKLNFGLWIQGSGSIVEYINPALTPQTIGERIKELLSVISRIQSFSNILIWKADRDKFFQHIQDSRRESVKDAMLSATIGKAFSKLSDCSGRIMSCLDKENVALAHQVVSETVSSISEAPEMIQAIADLIDKRGELYEHASFVTLMATAISKKLGFSDVDLRIIALGSLFHDIGLTQLDIPDLYTKSLSREHQKTYERHPALGVIRLNDLEVSVRATFPEDAFVIIMQHHERFNGTGFPNGKRGRLTKTNLEGVHIFAGIVGLADTFAYYFEDRQGKPKYTLESALSAICRLDGCFDPPVMKEFLALMSYVPATISYHAWTPSK